MERAPIGATSSHFSAWLPLAPAVAVAHLPTMTEARTCAHGAQGGVRVRPKMCACYSNPRAGRLTSRSHQHEPARRPFNIPATPRSSSRSGQWMPIGMISKFARSFADALCKRGYHSSGVTILRPSASVTTSSVAVNSTERGRRSPTSISKVLTLPIVRPDVISDGE
jgi:hypothetical protein